MKKILQLITKRMFSLIITLVVMSFIIFLLVEIMPGDVAQMILGQSATEESLRDLRESMGLNDSVIRRYVTWVGNVIRGDLGTSAYMRNVPINDLLWRRVGHSLILALAAFIIFVPLSIVLGVIAGVKEKKWADSLISFFGLATMALPEFVSGVLLIIIFSVQLNILPIVSIIPIGETLMQNLEILVMPALSITFVMFGYVSRMQRSSMIQVMNSDYVRAATLKGLPKNYIIFRHALKNALLPTITIIGMNMGWLFGGLVVVETLFGFPGMGSLLMTAIKTRDVPLIEACVLLITIIYALSTMLTDILYSLLNPRIRHQGGQS
ncbi:MAG: ABC transporter permease [Sphaerochaetaceae bacterium]|jgi:peptide/nickel transport system permease protein|nr:ABC transporter permease [Sphaerochaetaceae bacterium]NLO61331.1 ABC transporter permease [Spirochaetales bacterium]MDD2406695.1 ABC transporter permease [Sphaerochaetaceae bacterium]MDD4259678.1 ABC transporter permease [Sphaerochaetaceae bacterium]MDD4763702.1 ABC transporter permease [Sphaerochaetaceae bacterium]